MQIVGLSYTRLPQLLIYQPDRKQKITYQISKKYMNKFDLEFLNGYIKSTLRLAKKIKNARTLEEAKSIAHMMEEKALKKLEESLGDL